LWPPPPVEDADGVGLADALAEALADALAEAEAVALADGLGVLVVTPPVHATPLTLNEVGTGLAPLHAPTKPIDTEPLVGTLLFQLRLAAVTCAPDCVQVALQPWLTFWLASGKSNASVQNVRGLPRLVSVTPPWNPPGHWLAIV